MVHCQGTDTVKLLLKKELFVVKASLETQLLLKALIKIYVVLYLL